MIIFKQKSYSAGNSQAGILEISSSGVKFTIGSKDPGRVRVSEFRSYKDRAKTKLGISGGKMNVEYFKENVLPAIYKYQEMAEKLGIDIYCVATAWAREISNFKEIQKIVPIRIRILSKKEEAEQAISAYLKMTKRNLRRYDNVFVADPGALSTEISTIDGKGLSVLNEDPGKKQKIQRYFSKELTGHKKNLLLITCRVFNPDTGKPDRWTALHDKPYPEEELFSNPSTMWIPDSLNLNSEDVYLNGATLGIGVLFNLKDLKLI